MQLAAGKMLLIKLKTKSSHDALLCVKHIGSSKENAMLEETYVAGKGSWGDNGGL